jgi:FtsP/CotA-like multicopper oxidase with cupredoxin domain
MKRSLIGFTRRSFVQGVTATAVLGSLPAAALTAQSKPAELSGTEFNLEIAKLGVNYTGRASTATAVNGQVPAPLLRMREGDTVTLRVTNRLSEPTSIHWHGLLVPPDMDGVPGISFAGIAPGETFIYRFTVRQTGTYWYHAHSLHEQTGLFGAIVVEPRTPPLAQQPERDYVVLLSDWTDEQPLQVFLNLKKMGSYYNFALPTTSDFFTDVSRLGLTAALAKRDKWSRTRMNPTDYGDISAATYTYLMNGTTPGANWTGIARVGERVRLRFVGAGAGTYFDVRIPGLKLQIVATDGQEVDPVEVDEFRIGPGETYDAIVQLTEDRAYTIFAQSIDRTGFARGTLAPRLGLHADVPTTDTPTWLTEADMMGAMGTTSKKVHHARSEYGASVDMRVDSPRDNLDDPGINLRGNGRRVLTYADLHTLGGALDTRDPGREIEMHLTGNMERFEWSFDGVKLNDAKPVHFREGERLRVTLVNDTTMTHPMHLHGMWCELESADKSFQVRKHTVTVQPAQRVSFAISADAPGRWAFHCHLLYHMAAGMFREVVVA